MDTIAKLFRRVWHRLNRAKFEQQLALEMEQHRADMHAPERFGNTLRHRELARDVWGWSWLDDILRDLSFAVRSLRRTPGFAITTIVSLVLGLTLATSLVAVVNAYLLRSLPFPHSERLYHVRYAPPGPWEPRGVSTLDWSSLSQVVEHPVTARGETFFIANDGPAQQLRGLRVNVGFLRALEIRTVLGRTLGASDFNAAANDDALIGYALWQARFGGDSTIIGREIRVDVGEQGGPTATFRIAGVLPPGFWFGRESSSTIDVLLPLRRPFQTYMVRLPVGVAPVVAERRLTDAVRALGESLPADWPGVHLESAHERYVGDVRSILIGVTIAGVLVLAIAITNVGVLVLLRALKRQHEMSIRVAIGAGRRHIARLVGAESLLLCASAVAITLVISHVLLAKLAPLIEGQLHRTAPHGVSAIGLDRTMLLLVGGAGVAIALSLSLLPLLTPWSKRLAATLRQGARHGTDGVSIRRLRAALIGFEVAGSLILLVGCGVATRSVVEMMRTNLGFRVEEIVRVRVVVPERAYPDAIAKLAFSDRLIQHAQSYTNGPAAMTSWPMFAESLAQPFFADNTGETKQLGGLLVVGTEYFDVLGVPVKYGRKFNDGDVEGTELVVIVSESLARTIWNTTNVIGRRVRTLDQPTQAETSATWRTIVGVVGDVRQSYSDADVKDVYLPYRQARPDRFASFVMRTPRTAAEVEAALRNSVAQSDPLAIVRGASELATENTQLIGARFLTYLFGGFAVFAAILAVIGMYGAIAFAVAQRQREFAVRIALGASGRAIVTLSMRGGAMMLGGGVITGVALALASGKFVQSKVFGARAIDVPMLLAACALLVGFGLLAIWWPARRAANANPVTILNDG